MALGEARAVGYAGGAPGGVQGSEGLLTFAAPARRQALLADAEQQRVVRSAIQQETGLAVRLRLITDGAAGADAPMDERSARYRAAEQHPLVVDLMKRFQAELIGRELVEVETWLQRLTAPPAPADRYEELGAIEVADG